MSTRVRRDPDLHDPAGRRQGLDHDWRRCPGRQRGRHRGDALLHQLSRQDEIRPGLEDEDDIRQIGDRPGAHHIQPRHPVERLLQRNRDQFFHLGRRKPHGQGLDLYLRRRELGKDVHRTSSRAGRRRRPSSPLREKPPDSESAGLSEQSSASAHLPARLELQVHPRDFPSDPIARASFRYPGLGAVQQGTADCHHLRTEGWTIRQKRQVIIDEVHSDGCTNEDQRFGIGVDPGLHLARRTEATRKARPSAPLRLPPGGASRTRVAPEPGLIRVIHGIKEDAALRDDQSRRRHPCRRCRHRARLPNRMSSSPSSSSSTSIGNTCAG